MPGVNDDCYVHYYVNNKTLQLLRRHFCLYLLRRRNNGGLFPAHSGRVCDKTPVSINNCGRGLCRTTSLCQESVNGLICERGYYLGGFKKMTGLICIIIGWMCTHTANTFQFKQHVVNFASDDPFKSMYGWTLYSLLEVKLDLDHEWFVRT